MNWELFKKWFTEMLLPNIPEQTRIIWIPYHNILSENESPANVMISSEFEQNKVYSRKKPELVELLAKMAPEPIYAVDEIASHLATRCSELHRIIQNYNL